MVNQMLVLRNSSASHLVISFQREHSNLILGTNSTPFNVKTIKNQGDFMSRPSLKQNKKQCYYFNK